MNEQNKRYSRFIRQMNDALEDQNDIVSQNLMNLEELAEATEVVGTAAADAGIEINQLSALISTISAQTKESGEAIGSGLASIIENLRNLSLDSITDTLNRANTSMTELRDGIQQLRNPLDILRDLSETYRNLDAASPLKSDILSNIGQGASASQLDALLSGWQDYEKMIADMEELRSNIAALKEEMQSSGGKSSSFLDDAKTVAAVTNTIFKGNSLGQRMI